MSRLLAAAAACFLVLCGARAGGAVAEREAAATVVVYNRNDAESAALAKYYAEKRGIPEENLVGLACTGEEAVSRDGYLVDIEAPLRAAFTKRGWWKIERDSSGRRYVRSTKMRFAAVMRGVPLKIRPRAKDPAEAGAQEIRPGNPEQTLARHDEASVDSELAAMFTLLEETPSALRNFYYRSFRRILDVAPEGVPLLVCRLDGPSDAIVRRMIDDAIATERSGLWGWAYLDARSIRDPGYIEGDDWIFRAGEMMRKKGIPVIEDRAPGVLLAGFPVTDAAIYYGWYESNVKGPFARENFKFLRGAVAVHIHSFSAHTVRSPAVAWAGPLLARGAAATMGNVWEPYLSLTVNFDILQDRLMAGFTLAESAYSASRAVSWMGTVLGDPLYRPYATWNSFDAKPDPGNPWQRYRSIVLAADGDVLAAAKELRAFAAETKNSMPVEALGQAQAAAGLHDDALRTLADASEIATSANIRFRLALEQIEILRRTGRKEEALKRLADALGVFRTDEQRSTLGRLALILQPPPPPSPAQKK